MSAERQRQYWQRNMRLTRALLALWFVVSFGFVFFAGDLRLNLFGWPFSFWMAAQGALVIFCGIIWYYAFTMNRLDREYGDPKGD